MKLESQPKWSRDQLVTTALAGALGNKTQAPQAEPSLYHLSSKRVHIAAFAHQQIHSDLFFLLLLLLRDLCPTPARAPIYAASLGPKPL